MPATTNRAERKAEVRTRAMPADTNPAGDIFGGWLMSQMDLAGEITARQRARTRVVTVAAVAIRQDSGDEVPVTAGVFVYVALGQDGQPVVVPEEV